MRVKTSSIARGQDRNLRIQGTNTEHRFHAQRSPTTPELRLDLPAPELPETGSCPSQAPSTELDPLLISARAGGLPHAQLTRRRAGQRQHRQQQWVSSSTGPALALHASRGQPNRTPPH